MFYILMQPMVMKTVTANLIQDVVLGDYLRDLYSPQLVLGKPYHPLPLTIPPRVTLKRSGKPFEGIVYFIG